MLGSDTAGVKAFTFSALLANSVMAHHKHNDRCNRQEVSRVQAIPLSHWRIEQPRAEKCEPFGDVIKAGVTAKESACA
ncbi:MAG: hypothetical protein KGZ91_06945 [Afipia sp.]|nr:hypothetical protein [Afipia sp.]